MLAVSIDLGATPEILGRLQSRSTNLRPLLLGIGEDEVLATKRRFSTASDPDGNLWLLNTLPTLEHKSGDTPLTGESKKLASTIHYKVFANSVLIGSNRKQAAMMQFGGTKEEFPHLWGDIPARPFLGFSDSDMDRIKQLITDYLA